MLAVEFGHNRGAQTLAAGLESVQRRARMLRKGFCAALLAPMFWKTGLQPGLSHFLGATSLVGRERGPRGSGWPVRCMGRSPRDHLKAGLSEPA
jgi:hypothetical protein